MIKFFIIAFFSIFFRHNAPNIQMSRISQDIENKKKEIANSQQRIELHFSLDFDQKEELATEIRDSSAVYEFDIYHNNVLIMTAHEGVTLSTQNIKFQSELIELLIVKMSILQTINRQ